MEEVSEIAKKEFNDLGLNESNNPLNPNGGILCLLANGQITNNNLALHIKHLLEKGKTKDAYRLMKNIRGIGSKIASFYLRDIAYLGGIRER